LRFAWYTRARIVESFEPTSAAASAEVRS